MKESKIIKQKDNPIFFTLFISMLWAKDILLGYISVAIRKMPIPEAVGNYLVPALMLLLFLLSFRTITDRLLGQDFVFVFVVLLVYVAEYVIYPHVRPYFEDYYLDFVTTVLPFYFVGVALRGDGEELLIKYLYVISVVSILCFSAYMMFMREMPEIYVRAGDMDNAYKLLPHACMVFYRNTESPRWPSAIVSLISALTIVLLGTRGAVLCFGVFIALSLMVNTRMRKPLLFLSVTVIVMGIILIPGVWEKIVEWMYNVALRLGMSTRVFDIISSGNFSVSASRDSLKTKIVYYLKDYMYTGLGIYGDRFVTNGQYVHNIFYEFWADFGYIIGSLGILVIAVMCVRAVLYALRRCTDNTKLTVILILGCLLKLMASSSYMVEPFFWLMLGYFTALRREERALNYQVDRSRYTCSIKGQKEIAARRNYFR